MRQERDWVLDQTVACWPNRVAWLERADQAIARLERLLSEGRTGRSS